ncbi:MAG: insulinase family protein [Clostridia bacterium]|nr:insulinase family protein [Clostridia bacterium]
MKKFTSLLLSLALLLTVFSIVAGEGEAASSGSNGFTLTDERRFELLGADIKLYEHDKTGALVMFILNDDLNRVFEITFRTPAETDMGTPHVFEHSVLDGSEKYPSKTLFFNLSYQTYNTYMNASTYNFMTTYPVASLSEEQLLKYADFYTDSVFNPIVLEDKSIFDEEAWRYVLTDADSELTVAGTVYSEMLGAYTINRAASLNFDNVLFPGSTSGRDHGGKPTEIVKMTHEDLKQYHAKYYHPSNTLTCIYGKIEQPDAFLKLLDGYFSAYEKADIVIDDAEYTPISGPQEAVFEYGLAADAKTEDGALIFYGFVCDTPDEELDKIDFLSTMINDDSSYFQQRIKDELPSANAACYIDLSTPSYAFYFYATGVDAEDAPLFKQIADDSIADVIANGFDEDSVDAIVQSTKLDLLLAGESSSLGVDMIPNIVYYWAATDKLYGYMDFIDALDNFEAWAKDGTLAAAAEKYLAGNENSALVVTVPVAGLKEVQDAEFASQLAEIKAAMSEDEIAAIIASANAEDTTASADEYVKALTAVTVASLPEEVREYDIFDDVDENGIRHVDVLANTDGVGKTAILLDAQGLTQDQLHYFKLFVDMLGNLNTSSHTRKEISALTTRYMYDGVIRVSAMEEGDACHPYLRATFTALDEDLTAGYDLVYELIFGTDLTDAKAIKDNVTNLKNSLKQSLTSSAYQVILYRALATEEATSAYFNYVSYLDYYDFLVKTEEALDSDPETVLANLAAVQQYFNNRTNAIAAFVGNEESIAVNAAAADEFLLKLGESEITAQTYDFGEYPGSEALIIDGSVQYNMYYASWEALGLEGYDGAMEAITSYVSDTYLYPLLRDQYGAYGVMHYATDSGIYVISYRDPNIAETFEVYDSLPELIATDEPSQETLDGYILSSYSGYALSSGELTGGFNTLLNYIGGDDGSDTITYMQQLKGVTPETFAQYSSLYEKFAENSIYATAGSAAKINQYADIYGRILNPFSVQDASEQEFADLTEDYVYFDEVRACFENALIFPNSETEFGVNEAATLGELAAGIYSYLGYGSDQQEAVSFLSGYGLIPAESPDTELTREDLAYYTAYICMGLGVEVSEVAIDEYADAADVTEGAEGLVGWTVAAGLLPMEDENIYPQRTATKGELCYDLYYLLIAE